MRCCANCRWWMKPDEEYGECHGSAPVTFPNNMNRTPVWTRTPANEVCAVYQEKEAEPVKVVDPPKTVETPKVPDKRKRGRKKSTSASET